MSIYKKSLFHEDFVSSEKIKKKSNLTMDDVNNYFEDKEVYDEAIRDSVNNIVNKGKDFVSKVGSSKFVKRAGTVAKAGVAAGAVAAGAGLGVAAGTAVGVAAQGFKSWFNGMRGDADKKVGGEKSIQVPDVSAFQYDAKNEIHKQYEKSDKTSAINDILNWSIIGGTIQNIFKGTGNDPKAPDAPTNTVAKAAPETIGSATPGLQGSQFADTFSTGNAKLTDLFNKNLVSPEQRQVLDNWAVSDKEKYNQAVNLLGRGAKLETAINKSAAMDTGIGMQMNSAYVQLNPNDFLYTELNETFSQKVGQGLFGTKSAIGSGKKNMLMVLLAEGLVKAKIKTPDGTYIPAYTDSNGNFNEGLARQEIAEKLDRITRSQTKSDDIAFMYRQFMKDFGYTINTDLPVISSSDIIEGKTAAEGAKKETETAIAAIKQEKGFAEEPQPQGNQQVQAQPNTQGTPQTTPQATVQPQGQPNAQPQGNEEQPYRVQANTVLKLNPNENPQTSQHIAQAINKSAAIKSVLKSAGVDLNNVTVKAARSTKGNYLAAILETNFILDFESTVYEEEFQPNVAGNSSGKPNLPAKQGQTLPAKRGANLPATPGQRQLMSQGKNQVANQTQPSTQVEKTINGKATPVNNQIQQQNKPGTIKAGTFDKDSSKVKVKKLFKPTLVAKLKEAVMANPELNKILNNVAFKGAKRVHKDVTIGRTSAGKVVIIFEDCLLKEENAKVYQEDTKKEVMKKGYNSETIQNLLYG